VYTIRFLSFLVIALPESAYRRGGHAGPPGFSHRSGGALGRHLGVPTQIPGAPSRTKQEGWQGG
jgi:hypothetical protein